MPAVLDYPVYARQRLTLDQLRDEALRLYAEYRDSGGTQGPLAERIGTRQSAVSAAVNARADEASTHAAVYLGMVNVLDPTYRVREERTVEYRVERKG